MTITSLKLYHFVAREEMYNNICNFSVDVKLNFSKTMRLIINTMTPLLDYYLFFENESGDFGYNNIEAEVDIRFYIDPKVYRKLRNTHGVMHTFSVAVLVRKMIELFFILLEAKGLNWIINTMKLGIKKIINYFTKNGRFLKNTDKMIHMFDKDDINEYISFVFSKNYTLLGIELEKKRILYQN